MLTLQFVPYSEIENLDTESRIDKLLNIVKDNKIVLMQGRLNPDEETKLIQQTMQEISKEFKGIEICTIYPEEKDLQILKRLRKEMVKALLGNRDGLTIIGPATVVKEIKRDLNKIQLFTAIPRRSGSIKISRRSAKKKVKRTKKRRR